MKPQKDKGGLILDYLSRYPTWFPSGSLAAVIYSDHKGFFDGPEQIRGLIRYYRGAQGDRLRKQLKTVDFKDVIKRKSTSFVQPETWAKEKRVYTLPTGLKNIGFCSDHQYPFQDNKAIDVCYNHFAKSGVDSILINGDFADFYAASDFEKDPKERDFVEEREAVMEGLIYLKKSFPNIPIYYNLDANHEARWSRWMRTKSPLIYKLELFEIEDLLYLSDIGIIPIRNYDHLKIGKLACVHGDTVFRKGSGNLPSKKMADKFKVSTIASHVHRTTEYTFKNLYGEMSACWTVGMLAHPNMEYCKHVDEYNQGFARIEKDASGYFEVHNHRIIDYKVR